MTYDEIRSYILNLETRGIRPGTETVNELLLKLGNPQDKLHCIHVAGTNGKGSVCTMLAAILKESGYKVGRYSSPAIKDPREIIRINEEMISEELYVRSAEKVMGAGNDPTVFEFETAMAFCAFEEAGCDVVIIETGMGGRDDATNVLKNPLAVILTSISLDHMKYLGDNVEMIAENKCGIIKDGCHVISDHSNKDIKTIERECERHKAILSLADPVQDIKNVDMGIVFSTKLYKDITISLSGSYQAENASLAIKAANVLMNNGLDKINEDAMRKALLKVNWPGRYEKISLSPLIIVDGAHNRGAVSVLLRSIRSEYPDKKIILLMAVFADKEYEIMLYMLSSISDTIICTTSGKERSLSPKELASCAGKFFKNTYEFASFKEAFAEGRKLVENEDAALLICGSLSNYKCI